MDEFQFVDRSLRNILDVWKIFSCGYFKKTKYAPCGWALFFSFTGLKIKKVGALRKYVWGIFLAGVERRVVPQGQ
ncbi:MAG: hypothetical protein ACLTBZ_08820 [Faecalispora jeddahensis]|uniref:hypothetical protein n=1 Tax=Eubacteriales TaxID=186802 RepID=UPI0012DE9B7B|nr:hypothetical protein [Clostridium sp. MSTE9]